MFEKVDRSLHYTQVTESMNRELEAAFSRSEPQRHLLRDFYPSEHMRSSLLPHGPNVYR